MGLIPVEVDTDADVLFGIVIDLQRTFHLHFTVQVNKIGRVGVFYSKTTNYQWK